MAQQTRTGRLAGLSTDPALAETDQGGRVGATGIFEAIWDLLTSMRFSLVVILGMAAFGLIGAFLIQIPAGVAGDPTAKADWIAGVRPRFGGWTEVFDRLQLFSVFSSVWFRGLTGFLTISLVACMIQRTPRLWRTATKPRVTVGDGFFAHARERDAIVVQGTAEDLTARVSSVLHKHHYRVLDEDDGQVNLYADRFRWAPFGSMLGHLSIVVIFAGVLVGSLFGFRDNAFVIAEGATLAVPSGQGLSLKLITFQDAYYSNTGAPSDYASELVLYKDGKQVLSHTARVNDPLRYGDLSFYQSFYGPAALMSVADANGASLYAEGVPLAWQTKDDKRSVGTFTIAARDLVVWVVGTRGSGDPLVKPGQIRIETYTASTGAPIDQKTIDQGKPTTISGLTYTFGRELQYTGLTVARDPGTILVWLGSIVLIVGFTIGFVFPHRRLWARLVMRPGDTGTLHVATPGRVTHDADRAFTNLVTELRAACAASTPA